MTVFALSSGGGRAGIAIVRVSGDRTGIVIEALTGLPPPPARRATLVNFRNPIDDEIIDRGILLWYPSPHSFTGEDVAELHVHGGVAVVSAILAALGEIPGLRPAEAGEFTRIAFEHGKFDLTQAEAIADLVNAETVAQRRQARRQLDGELGSLYENWRADLVSCLAHLEAFIDFPDEDLPPYIETRISERLVTTTKAIQTHLDDHRRGERLREGFYVVIIGAPNVGKSSLLNCLAQRDAAIIAATAGTTRDVIEVRLDVGGFPITLADTAGLRDATDDVESQGVSRTRESARNADLKLAIFSMERLDLPDPYTTDLIDDSTIVVVNKIDLHKLVEGVQIEGRSVIGVSARTGENIDVLMDRLIEVIGSRYTPSAAPVITRQRHRQALACCVDGLERARDQLANKVPIELAAEDLRLAVRSLGRITGRVDIEDILDVVFADFCIGK